MRGSICDRLEEDTELPKTLMHFEAKGNLSIASASKRTQKASITNELQLEISTLSSKQVQLGQTQDISDGYTLEVALGYSNFEPAAVSYAGNGGLRVGDEVSQIGSSTTDSAFHLPSEKVYYRFPVVIPYNSPIFICVQNGDIPGMRKLWGLGQGSIDVVDPYGLGLLYYSTYYCWRNHGAATAMEMSKELLQAGANHEWRDEIGNTPMETMIEAVLIDSATNGQPFSSALFDVGQLFAKPLDDLWRDYKESRGFTELHEVLLCINQDSGTLGDYLSRAAAEGTVSDIIDAPDASGRSALSWAVEHGWAYAVATLIGFGANVQAIINILTFSLLSLSIFLAWAL